jgi:hypothetical protein
VVVRGAGAGTGWGRSHRLSPAASVTDGPALVALPSGGMRVGAVGGDGSLLSRRIDTPKGDLSGARRGGFSLRPLLGL